MHSWECGRTNINYEGGFKGEVVIQDKKTGAKVSMRAIDLQRFMGLRVRDMRIHALEVADPITLLTHG